MIGVATIVVDRDCKNCVWSCDNCDFCDIWGWRCNNRGWLRQLRTLQQLWSHQGYLGSFSGCMHKKGKRCMLSAQSCVGNQCIGDPAWWVCVGYNVCEMYLFSESTCIEVNDARENRCNDASDFVGLKMNNLCNNRSNSSLALVNDRLRSCLLS